MSASLAHLSERDRLFLERVGSDGLDRYRRRLAAIGFTGLGDVLDAGAGFGQWSMALAETSRRVTAIDHSGDRVAAARVLARAYSNIGFDVGSVAALPYADRSFDAVFSYSVIYYTDVRRTVGEFARVLRPGGRLYICSNGPGWYLHNIVSNPNASRDFSPRAYGVRTFCKTVRYRALGTPPAAGGSVVTGIAYLGRLLARSGIEVIGAGPEGSLRLSPSSPPPVPFFRGRYLGLECVSEWLGVRRPADEDAGPHPRRNGKVTGTGPP
jgi:SAM-dependent methyltransferase